MVKKIFLLTTLIFITFSLNHAYELNILEETPNMIKLELLLDNIKFTENKDFMTIQMKNGIRPNTPGTPDIPNIQLNFTVPENGDLNLSINRFNNKNVKLNKPISPVVSFKEIKDNISSDTKFIERYDINDSSYLSRKSMYEILPKQVFNQYDIITVIINPINYDHQYKQVNYPERIILTVNITGDFPKNISEKEHDLYSSFIVNNKYGMSFVRDRTKDFYTSNFSRFPVWYKFEVNNEGMHILDSQSLNNLPISDIDPRTIRIFSTGGAMLPNHFSEPGMPFEEIPLLIIGEENGTFNQNDKIIFYAQTRDGLGKNLPLASYTQSNNDLVFDSLGDYHYYNPYSQNGVYWITWGADSQNPPKRMNTTNLSSHDKTRNFGKIITHFEEAKTRRDLHGLNWFTLLMSGISLSEYSYNLNFNNLVTTENQRLEIVLQSENHNESGRRVDVNINDSQATTVFWYDTALIKRTKTNKFLTEGNNNISFKKYTGENLYLKYFNIQWYQTLVKENKPLTYSLHDDDYNTKVKYSFNNIYNQNVRAFQVNNFKDVNTLTISGNSFTANGTEDTKIFVCSDNDYLKPINIHLANVVVLDNNPVQHDVLIIYPEEFTDGAMRMNQIYQTYYQYNTLMINQQDIFDNFSGGHPDPVAIRNYLQYLQFNCPTPKPIGALLIGAGTFDHRNFYGKLTTKNKLITNQVHSNSLDADKNTTTTDDYYAHLTQHNRPEIIIGRIPAKTTNELNNYINKLEDYLNNPNPGLWQYTFQIIADDNVYRDYEGETSHTNYSQNTADEIEENILVDKLYAIEYEMDAFKRKPQVRQLLIDKINEGRLYWYYNGHGSYENLGDERYFRLNADLPSLNNYQKYHIFVAASCNVGEYDNPNYDSLAEGLLLLNNAGSIASIASTRMSLGGSNSNLMIAFFREAVNNRKSIGHAMLNAKISHNAPSNNKFYNILGDPFLKTAYPEIRENISIIPQTDTLKLRQTVFFEGDFEENSLNNTVHNLVYDSGLRYIYTTPNGSATTNFLTKDNLPLFKGYSSVTQGAYSASFTIPDDAYSGNKGKIISYGIDALNSKSFINKKTKIKYSDKSVVVANLDKPNIELFIDNLDFVSGNTVSPNPTLIAKISDDNGINILGKSGHNIMVVIDTIQEPIIVTNGFVYDLDSHTSGTLNWKLSGLKTGMHNLQIIVYDNFNEISIAETWFITAESVPLAINNALVYPNPIKKDGHFTFDLSHDADITINIFTITGRKIQTIRKYNLKSGYNQIYWNGRDIDGDRIANNTYFYTINAKSTEAKGSAKITEKLIILK